MPTQPIHKGDTIVFVGDSITAGTPPPNGWFGPAVATLDAALTKPGVGSASGGVGSASGGVGASQPINGVNVVNSGVGGNVIANIAAAVAARITNYNPHDVVLEVGVNDTPASAGTPLAAFRASSDSIWTQVKAARPAARLWAMSIFVWGEMWTPIPAPGPNWDNPYDPPPGVPPFTPTIEQYNAELQASVEAFGGIYVDTRAATLAYEAANVVPPGAHVGPLTIDGLHPNLAGQTLMSSEFMATVQITP